jgi:hypothetical protein
VRLPKRRSRRIAAFSSCRRIRVSKECKILQGFSPSLSLPCLLYRLSQSNYGNFGASSTRGLFLFPRENSFRTKQTTCLLVPQHHRTRRKKVPVEKDAWIFRLAGRDGRGHPRVHVTRSSCKLSRSLSRSGPTGLSAPVGRGVEVGHLRRYCLRRFP